MCSYLHKLCDYFDKLVDEGYFNPYINFLNGVMRRLGSVLVVVVYFISIFLSITSFAIILPYEQLYKSPYLLSILSPIGLLLLINIQFHYYKARTLPPVLNPGKEGDRLCRVCIAPKSDRTHHCSICRTCVLGMDHHCIWINQCVGSHNHRHFFLFIANLTIAAFTIVCAGFNTAYDHVFVESAENSFCSANLYLAPLQGFICEHDGLARNCVIFAFFLSIILGLLVGFLTLWNCFLISRGMTYIDYLNFSNAKQYNPNHQNLLNKGFFNNWKNFFGIRRKGLFFRRVILPSAHPPIHFDSYGRVEKFETV